MTMAPKSAQTTPPGADLDQVKQRFALWRAQRKPGAHVTDALWAAAVGLVGQHGVALVARELGIDPGRLKHRVGRGAAPARVGRGKPETQFVEVFATPAAVTPAPAACVVEMRNARGGTMRVELSNGDALAHLATAFWSAR